MTTPNYSIRTSGDGFELLDGQGETVAWTLDRKWALRILLGLELVNAGVRRSSNNDLYRHDDK